MTPRDVRAVRDLAEILDAAERWRRIERYVREQRAAARQATLDEVARAGGPHGCVPPCPFNRRIAGLRARAEDEGA
jgi:hypothetical protein